jgi:hypothetical protein
MKAVSRALIFEFCAATTLIVREAQCGSGKAASALQSNPPTAMGWLAHAVAERVSEKEASTLVAV